MSFCKAYVNPRVAILLGSFFAALVIIRSVVPIDAARRIRVITPPVAAAK